jgi:putative hydrolase of the HAD superfamily
MRESRSKLFLHLLGINENFAAAFTEIYVKDYPTVKTPVAGAIPLVRKLSKKITVGVVSNGLPDVQYTKLETLGLRDLFSCIVLSEEFGVRKPDSRIFLHAASILKMQPSECLYIGDSYPIDIIGAKNAGMQACWLNRDGAKPRDEKIRADFVISKMQEFGEILGK